MKTEMRHVICMIPARMGSKRIHKKNIRYLDGKPLIAYAIDAAKASGIFSRIYVNSEDDIFSKIADKHGVSFYKRPPEFATNEATNDDFAYDFIQKVDGDYLVQLLCTSPLITPEEIRAFVIKMVSTNQETMASVIKHQIACIKGTQPVNFSYETPLCCSQQMEAVFSYAIVLMGWTFNSFKKNMKETGRAYYGEKGKVGFFELKGLSTIDIDEEEDFQLAEAAMKCRNSGVSVPRYYDGKLSNIIVDVPMILAGDGIATTFFDEENSFVTHVNEVIDKNEKNISWCHNVINTENNSANLIAQMPGEGNRLHYHPNWNEWWYIVQGQWEWEIEGEKHLINKDDIIFIPKGKWHKITAVGDKMAIRLAVSKWGVSHIYD